MKLHTLISTAFLLTLVACGKGNDKANADHSERDGESNPNAKVVLELMQGFNDHDTDAMKELWADDVTWFEIVDGNSRAITSSAAQLYTELVTYFEAYPDVKSELEKISVNGNFVTAIETPVWEQDGVSKSQSSVVVYEIVDQKVKRFWYFPPQ